MKQDKKQKNDKTLWKLLILGLISRLFFYLLIIFFDPIIPDHDAQGVTRMDVTEMRFPFLQSFIRWDSVYYLRISLQGYQDEKDFAFFPFYPFLISLMMKLLGFQSLDLAVIVALTLNTICVLLTIIILWKLLNHLPGISHAHILTSILFFIFSPASIFFLTVYTESLFCLLSWSGMLLLQLNHVIPASFCFMFASLTRSNGIFNCIFIVSYYLITLLDNNPSLNSWSFLRCSLNACYASFFALLPFFFHSYFTFIHLCPHSTFEFNFESINQLEDENSCLSTDPTDGVLCNGYGVLSIYSLLQKKHWNVGFLNQYQGRQIPNFLLALPILSLTLLSLVHIFKTLLSLSHLNKFLLPYAAHLSALFIVVTLTAHIQISTRVFLSSSPLLFLHLFDLLSTNTWRTRLLCGWIIVYLFGGMILHSNYYPWT